MLTRYTVMPVDGEPQDHEVDLPELPSYDELKAIITPHLNGGLLEHVAVLDARNGDRRTDMFVDETGQLQGLARNEAATSVYRHNAIVRAAREGVLMNPESLPWIAGPAVLFSRRVWF